MIPLRPRITEKPKAGKIWDLKAEEMMQEGQEKQFSRDNPLETGPTMTESGEQLYTKKMQRIDERKQEAKMRARTRLSQFMLPGQK